MPWYPRVRSFNFRWSTIERAMMRDQYNLQFLTYHYSLNLFVRMEGGVRTICEGNERVAKKMEQLNSDLFSLWAIGMLINRERASASMNILPLKLVAQFLLKGIPDQCRETPFVEFPDMFRYKQALVSYFSDDDGVFC